MEEMLYRLVVKVIEGRGLANKELFGKSDPFVTLKLGNQSYMTTVIKNNLCPKWDQTFVFSSPDMDPELTVTMWAKDVLFKDSFMGTVTISMKDLLDFKAHDGWHHLEKRSSRSRSRVKGDIHLWIQLIPPGHPVPHIPSPQPLLRHQDKPVEGLVDEWCLVDEYNEYATYGNGNTKDGSNTNTTTNGGNHDKKDKGKGKEKKSNEVSSKNIYVGADNWEIDPHDSDAEVMRLLLLEREEQRIHDEEDERLLREYLASLNRCLACGAEGGEGKTITLECDHTFCPACIMAFIRSQNLLLNSEGIHNLPCPSRCGASLPEWVIKKVLPQSEYESLLNKMLQKFIDTRNDIFHCPNPSCAVLIERISKKTNAVEEEDMLKAHLEEFRMRCRACSTEFCSKCKNVPYHNNYTCESFSTYKNAKHCRFCQAAIPPSSSSSSSSSQHLAICGSEECTAKIEICCKKQLPCGHLCNGIQGEAKCMPCLQCGKMADEFCNICWVESLSSSPCLQLDCKHFFHFTCLKEKLRKKWPTARITFGFAECPLCKGRISHPSLKEDLAPILELKDVIESKASQRLEFEGLTKSKEVIEPTSKYFNKPTEYAMHRYAYFMCAKCMRPYFAGQRRCDAGDDEDKPFDPADLVCGGCSGSQPAAECAKHGKEFLEWKCQFCCSVSSWYCWGKTHFCNDCHTKQQKGDYLTKKPKSAIPMCPGPDKCALGISHPHCEEFLLGCALCRNLQSF